MGAKLRAHHLPSIVSVCLQLEPPTGFLVQLYFARRHWILNRHQHFLSSVIVTVSFVAFAFGMSTSYLLLSSTLADTPSSNRGLVKCYSSVRPVRRLHLPGHGLAGWKCDR